MRVNMPFVEDDSVYVRMLFVMRATIANVD